MKKKDLKIYEKIFLIFDVNGNTNKDQVLKYAQEGISKGYHIIISNFCIKSWLYLYHQNGLRRMHQL